MIPTGIGGRLHKVKPKEVTPDVTIPIYRYRFALGVGESRVYEVAEFSVFFLLEGSGNLAAALDVKFGLTGDPFRLNRGSIIRLSGCKQITLRNLSAASITGVFLTTADRDFWYNQWDQGLVPL